MVKEKRCTKCERFQPRSAFTKHKTTSDRLQPSCRTCNAEAARAWAKAHPERRKQITKTWAQKNAVKCNANSKAWKRKNAAASNAATLAWQAANPTKMAANRARRSQLERNAPGGSFRANIRSGVYAERLAEYRGLCAYCKRAKATTWDHAIPLSRSGSNHYYNVFPACAQCNHGVDGKHDKILWLEWDPPCAKGWD